MQSPTIIVGLHRIATSLWLRFAALRQRVPVFAHRRKSPPVMNVIDRLPPSWLQQIGAPTNCIEDDFSLLPVAISFKRSAWFV
jgi:hypothetical protein